MEGEQSETEANGAILQALSELTTGATLLKAGRSVRKELKWLLEPGFEPTCAILYPFPCKAKKKNKKNKEGEVYTGVSGNLWICHYNQCRLLNNRAFSFAFTVAWNWCMWSDYLTLVYVLNTDQVVRLVQNSLQASQLMDLSGKYVWYYYLLYF